MESKKRSKIFVAFQGDAVGLRDELIEHFKHEADAIATNSGTTWNEGLDDGKRLAYKELVRFLKKLVINNNEHLDETDPT